MIGTPRTAPPTNEIGTVPPSLVIVDKRAYDKVAPIHRADLAYLKSAIDKNADPRLVERVEAIRKDRANKIELEKQARNNDKRNADKRRKLSSEATDSEKTEVEDDGDGSDAGDIDHVGTLDSPNLGASAFGDTVDLSGASATTEEIVEVDPDAPAPSEENKAAGTPEE